MGLMGMWGSAALFIAVLLYRRHLGVSDEVGDASLAEWLETNGFPAAVSKLSSAGIDSLEQLMLSEDVSSQLMLDVEQRGKYQRALRKLKDEKALDLWLRSNGIHSHKASLQGKGIRGLETLLEAMAVERKAIVPDQTFSKALKDLHTQSKTAQNTDELIHEFISKFSGVTSSFRPSLLTDVVVSLFISGLVTMLLTYVQQSWRGGGGGRGGGTWLVQPWTGPSKSSRTFLELLTGRYSTPLVSTVHWDWSEPQCVGSTRTFSIRFFQRKNGKPYFVSNADNILVEIVHGGVKVATSIEMGSTEPADANLVRVSFSVHKSGDYQISVMVGGKHISDSPFTKTFLPGPIDASKTGFMNYSSTVVCTAGTSHPLTIDTRDAFGNVATYKTDQINYFKINVKECGTNVKYVPATQIFYDPTDKKLTMHILMERPGCYTASVSYGDAKLKNGEFNILVLSDDEAGQVKKNLTKKSHNMWYEARLMAMGPDTLDKPKKVYVYISPKQLTIKEFYLRIIGKKVTAFRVCPSTKFQFNGFNDQYQAPVFTIDDGSQPPLVLAAKDRSSIAATFINFLLRNIGGSETFQDKQTFFNHKIRQLHARRTHSALCLKINRANLLHGSYKYTKHYDLADWCRRFEISFLGEEGLDWGGLRREWFQLLCKELFDPNCSGLFTRFSDDPQGLVHPNPRRSGDLGLKYYEFAGKIVGKCLYESTLGPGYRLLVNARFSRSFLALIIGLRVNYRHFETDDPELYKTKIEYIENNDIEDMDLTFSEEEYGENGQLLRVVDLIPNGAKVKVDNRNKLRYLDLLAQYRLSTRVKDEVDAFLKGLNELIPDNLLSIFDENELELLMCGTGHYSITDFKQNHTVVQPTPSFNKVYEWFWTVVASFSEEQMARMLQFTTGCSQLPPGGFGDLRPKIQITSAPSYNALPSAHTCINQLCLPDYDNIETFHRCLLLAINEGNQGFGFV